MVITSYGISCFKVTSGQLVLAFDPPSRKSKTKSPYFQTDILLISHDHENHNGREVLHAPKDGEIFIIDGPGEYEYKGVIVEGIPSFHDNQDGKKSGLNTIYRVELEDIVLLHLGDFGEKELRPETKEKIGNIDILFIPIGGEKVLDPETAAEIANQIEPRIIIPAHYSELPEANKKAALKEFLEEIGARNIKPEEKLTIKKKELPQDETKIVVLEPSI
ncbi:MAG: MBL fold metallo-hydrolase [Patescibacteria group bacterium]